MTTCHISELKGMGNYDRAIAVGMILLTISFYNKCTAVSFSGTGEQVT